MKNPAKVAELLSADWYKEQWPRIPPEELDASSVALPHMASDGVTLTATKVLMHKRRSSHLSKRSFAMNAIFTQNTYAHSLRPSGMVRYCQQNKAVLTLLYALDENKDLIQCTERLQK